MTEQLVHLPAIARISPRVIRILGQNPGKFTLQGTNTYLISSSDSSGSESIPSVLIDAAEGEEAYLPLLTQVLSGKSQEAGPSKRHITDIILTHWHGDHVAGLASVLQHLSTLSSQQPPPRIHKFANEVQDPEIAASIENQEKNFTASGSSSLHTVADEARIAIGSDCTLRALHTPGHTTDHLSFVLEQEKLFFSGDNVLGQGTSVFEDLGAYLSSLDRSLEVLEAIGSVDEAGGENIILPAHGPVIKEGRRTIQTYRSHRLDREKQVLDLLRSESPKSAKDDSTGNHLWTVMDIVRQLYKGCE